MGDGDGTCITSRKNNNGRLTDVGQWTRTDFLGRGGMWGWGVGGGNGKGAKEVLCKRTPEKGSIIRMVDFQKKKKKKKNEANNNKELLSTALGTFYERCC